MKWSAFCAHLAHAYERSAERADTTTLRPRPFGPPSLDELRGTPWGGDGDDPLDAELQQLLEDEA